MFIVLHPELIKALRRRQCASIRVISGMAVYSTRGGRLHHMLVDPSWTK